MAAHAMACMHLLACVLDFYNVFGFMFFSRKLSVKHVGSIDRDMWLIYGTLPNGCEYVTLNVDSYTHTFGPI